MADTIFFARVINADHCLQASIVTTAVALLSIFVVVVVVVGADAFLVATFVGLVVVVAFFTLGFATDDAEADDAGRSFLAAEAIVRPPLVADRVDRTIVWKVVNPVDILNVTITGTMYR
jgi:hypothetical protein